MNATDEKKPDPGPSWQTSRRGFLKGVGIAAGATMVLPALGDSPAVADPDLEELGAAAREISLRVNGAARKVSVEPRTTLLETLRTQLDLTGSKEICDRGSCGGCTVLLDGKAVNSCLLTAIDAQGHEVTTIEGIAADPKHAHVIDAFCDHDAAQCGFCIPGFVVRTVAFLGENPSPSGEQIREGLAGNLCRCGTYTKIFDAVDAAAKGVAK